jgi:hypothetical protein
VSDRACIRVASAAALWATLAPVSAARAQMSPGAEPWLEPPAPRPAVARPRLTVSIGTGATFDSVGFTDGTHALPSFFATGGIGEGMTGFEMAVFASQASGRYRAPETPVDRLALDGMVVVRFLAQRLSAQDYRYQARVGRTAAFEIGLAVERAARGAISATRFGMHTGARIELPLVPYGTPNEPRLRFGVRRMLGAGSPAVGDTSVHDSTELYAALALSF